MRTDECGNQVPSTLGEYLDLVRAIAPDSRAVEFLEEKVAASPAGRNDEVLAPDSQMRILLYPMMVQPRRSPVGR